MAFMKKYFSRSEFYLADIVDEQEVEILIDSVQSASAHFDGGSYDWAAQQLGFEVDSWSDYHAAVQELREIISEHAA